METIFKKAINIKHLRFAAGDNAIEVWGSNIIRASLEKPLITTFVAMTIGSIVLALFLMLFVTFTGVLCITIIIILLEGFVLVAVVSFLGVIITICLYIYVTITTVIVYFDQKPINF